VAVDALLERRQLHDFINAKLARLGYVSFNGDGPRRGLEVRGVLGGLLFAGAELVEVVVVGDVVVGVRFFSCAEWALEEVWQFGAGLGAEQLMGAEKGRGNAGQEFAPVQVNGFGVTSE